MLSHQIHSAHIRRTSNCPSSDRHKESHHSSPISPLCIPSKLPPHMPRSHVSQLALKPGIVSNKHHEVIHPSQNWISLPLTTPDPSDNQANLRYRLSRPQPSGAFSKAKRKRISPAQLSVLSSLFEITDTPSFDQRETTAAQLGMTNREVQVWFQNRRAKLVRDKSTGLETYPASENVPSRPLEAFSSTPTRVLPECSASRFGQACNFHSARPTNTHDVTCSNKLMEASPEENYPVRSASTLTPQIIATHTHPSVEGPHIQGIHLRPYQQRSLSPTEEQYGLRSQTSLADRTCRGPHRGMRRSRSPSVSCSQSTQDFSCIYGDEMNRCGTPSAGSFDDDYNTGRARLSSLSRSSPPLINGSINHHGLWARVESDLTSSKFAHTTAAPYSITPLFGHSSQQYPVSSRTHSTATSASQSVTSFASEFPISKPTSSYGSSASASEVSVDRKSHLPSLLNARNLPPLPLEQRAGPGSFPICHPPVPVDKKEELDASLTLPPLMSGISAETSTHQLCQAFNRLPSLKANLDHPHHPSPVMIPSKSAL